MNLDELLSTLPMCRIPYQGIVDRKPFFLSWSMIHKYEYAWNARCTLGHPSEDVQLERARYHLQIFCHYNI